MTRKIINKETGGSLSAPHGHMQQVKQSKEMMPTTDKPSYRPGYSESDFTSQSEDETRPRDWTGRGLLDLPPCPPAVTPTASPLSPPFLEISPVNPNMIVSPEMARTSPGPLQVSLDISSIHLVQSPNNLSHPGSIELSPAQGLAHSSANYTSHEGLIQDDVRKELNKCQDDGNNINSAAPDNTNKIYISQTENIQNPVNKDIEHAKEGSVVNKMAKM